MKSYKFLINSVEGQAYERTIEGSTLPAALHALTLQLFNSEALVTSIDYMQGSDTPELVKARKNKKKPSRADRFSDAIGNVASAREEIENLRDELQDWFDNMPENLQSGEKAGTLEEAISNLETVSDSLQEAEGTDVEFPGMY